MYYLRGRSNQGAKVVEVKPILCPENFNFEALLKEADDAEQRSFFENEDPLQEAPTPFLQASNEVVTTKRSYQEAFPENKKVNPSHRRRRAKRNERIKADGHSPHPKALTSVLKASKPILTDLKSSKLPATSCGTQALHYRPKGEAIGRKRVEDLQAEGYTLIPSDPKVPRPMLDRDQRIIGAYCGHLNDPEYLNACARVYELFEDIGKNPGLKDEAVNNRRGFFPVINVGITHGKGTSHPVNLHEGKDKLGKFEAIAREALQDSDLNRLATFQSACFKIWSPQVYEEYRTDLDSLYKKRPHLRRNFSKSVFPCCAINCGPTAWTSKHRDSMNLPYGLCAITALGRFNHHTGGHLVLPDLKLIIEFPVGSVILLPSATLVHANIAVQEHECRASFTQFAAGGLFRYIKSDFMTEKALKMKDKSKYAKVCEEKKSRWQRGLNLLSKFAELVADLEEEEEEEEEGSIFK